MMTQQMGRATWAWTSPRTGASYALTERDDGCFDLTIRTAGSVNTTASLVLHVETVEDLADTFGQAAARAKERAADR